MSFPEGLAIITGETGAGKSILLGALSLLTGAKGDASLVSSGAESCVVEGEFENADESLRSLLEENEVEWAEDGSLIIRRILYSTGRSRSFVNDCPVNLPVLAKCSELLIDIHSQHNKLILSDKRYQLRVLDLFAGNSEHLRKCGELWRELQELHSRKAKAEKELESLKRDFDYNQAQFIQLDSAKLRDGEMEELDEEQKRLSNAEEIKSSLETALASFEPGEEQTLDSALREASRLLEKISAFVPSLKELSERIESSRIELGDVRDTIEREAEKVDVSGDRLEQVEERMG
ncbi:MAG TPA: AAA family ATPase, partial [Candidatus Cryptobacteroides sp.]|nr:AAA family ATPase [Candidatus Cryptobacteroides sp.]